MAAWFLEFARRLKSFMYFTVYPVGQRRVAVRLVHNTSNGPIPSGDVAHLDPAHWFRLGSIKSVLGTPSRPRIGPGL